MTNVSWSKWVMETERLTWQISVIFHKYSSNNPLENIFANRLPFFFNCTKGRGLIVMLKQLYIYQNLKTLWRINNKNFCSRHWLSLLVCLERVHIIGFVLFTKEKLLQKPRRGWGILVKALFFYGIIFCSKNYFLLLLYFLNFIIRTDCLFIITFNHWDNVS